MKFDVGRYSKIIKSIYYKNIGVKLTLKRNHVNYQIVIADTNNKEGFVTTYIDNADKTQFKKYKQVYSKLDRLIKRAGGNVSKK